MDIVFWFSVAVFAITVLGALDAALGIRRIGELADVSPVLPADPPSLTVIVPARNEAQTIEPALRSIIALEYPRLEVVVIDDRSEDATGEIVDRLGVEFPALRVLHVRELPPAWLGKNHALHMGASRAQGDYFLFSDADVHYEPTVLKRAMAFCLERRLDHLTIFPDIPVRSAFLQWGSVGGLVGLLMLYRPWKARESGRHGLGIGAFNLVRAETYRKAGSHAAIAMEIVDDIELGRLMGEHGRQDMLFGMRMISVEIYRTAAEAFRGVQKNGFAFLRFSGVMVLAATLGILALHVWPWAGIFATEGVTRLINAGTAAAIVGINAAVARRFGYGPGCLRYVPLNGVILIALFWQIAIVTWLRGGVTWRRTFYPLEELKRRKRP